MIKLIDNYFDFPENWEGDDAFAAKVTALFETYGTLYPFADFWYQTAGGAVTAIISRVDGNMTVSTVPGADREEIISFIEAIGYSTLSCSGELIEADGSFIVEYKGSKGSGDLSPPGDNLLEVYTLLKKCGFEMGDYGSFLADFCARLRKETALCSVKYDENGLASTASAIFIGTKSVLLGAVATAPDSRGKGYAGELVISLARSFPGKKVFLFCRNDGLLSFYEKLGFVETGRWSLTER